MFFSYLLSLLATAWCFLCEGQDVMCHPMRSCNAWLCRVLTVAKASTANNIFRPKKHFNAVFCYSRNGGKKWRTIVKVLLSTAISLATAVICCFWFFLDFVWHCFPVVASCFLHNWNRLVSQEYNRLKMPWAKFFRTPLMQCQVFVRGLYYNWWVDWLDNWWICSQNKRNETSFILNFAICGLAEVSRPDTI